MKDELSGRIMTKFVRIRAKPYSYLIDDGSEDKKAKGRKPCVVKRKLKSRKSLEKLFRSESICE